MRDVEGRIILNGNVVLNYFLLKIRLSKPIGRSRPGQFIMLKLPGSEFFLRRPFSIYDHSGDTLSIMYRVVGKGTEYLSACKDGTVFVLGPLGNGFALKSCDSSVVVAGGIGYAGVHGLLKSLKTGAHLLFGASTKAETAILADCAIPEPLISTLDGSAGFRGTVTELLEERLSSLARGATEIFCCGPHGMLKSLKTLLEQRRIPCQASVEERMACGMGLCYGCVTETLDEEEPYKRACKEGPVFDLWQLCL
jgi:dihydroorotate dehydrogenase electron transfer subunit